MSAADNGGSAFPAYAFDVQSQQMLAQGGMTLRDYFAGKTMQAMIGKSSGQDSTGGAAGVPLIAKYAYEFADAMLAERAK